MRIKIPAGTTIHDACKTAASTAKAELDTVFFDFNGIDCYAKKDDTSEEVFERWIAAQAERGTQLHRCEACGSII